MPRSSPQSFSRADRARESRSSLQPLVSSVLLFVASWTLRPRGCPRIRSSLQSEDGPPLIRRAARRRRFLLVAVVVGWSALCSSRTRLGGFERREARTRNAAGVLGVISGEELLL